MRYYIAVTSPIPYLSYLRLLHTLEPSRLNPEFSFCLPRKLFLLVVFLLNACSHPVALQGEPLAFETIANGSVGQAPYGQKETQLFILSESSAFSTPAPFIADDVLQLVTTIQSVDFDHYFVIVVSRGIAGDPRHFGVTVESVIRQGNEVIIETSFAEPGTGARVNAVESYPYSVIAIPKLEQPVEEYQFTLEVDNQSTFTSLQFNP